MRAAVDVMGGDKAPAAILKGCWEAAPLLEADDLVYLIGCADTIAQGLKESGLTPEQLKRYETIATTEVIDMDDSPVEAIRIATLNGAIFLGRQDRIGSIAVGKNADLMVMKGDPATRIADIENVEIVFKDGAGYDTKKLLDSVRGRYGEY